MKQKQEGMMEILDVVIEMISLVRNHNDYDWIRKYGNTYLSVAKDNLEKAIEINSLHKNNDH